MRPSVWMLAALALAVSGARAGDTPAPESSFTVAFTKSAITVTSPKGEKRSVAWKDLTMVAVRMSDEGPEKPDVFWELHGTDDTGTIVFPGGATGEGALVEAMQSRLKGFDNKKLSEVMGSSGNATVSVWKKEQGKGGANIDGTWRPAAAEFAGMTFSEEVRKGTTLVVRGSAYTATVGTQVDKGTIALKPSSKPKKMTITGTEGPNQGKTIPAIYEINGDTLRVCYDLSGTKPPKEFKTTEGSKLYLVTYERQKP